MNRACTSHSTILFYFTKKESLFFKIGLAWAPHGHHLPCFQPSGFYSLHVQGQTLKNQCRLSVTLENCQEKKIKAKYTKE